MVLIFCLVQQFIAVHFSIQVGSFFIVPLAQRAVCDFVSHSFGVPICLCPGFQVQKASANSASVFYVVSFGAFKANTHTLFCHIRRNLFFYDNRFGQKVQHLVFYFLNPHRLTLFVCGLQSPLQFNISLSGIPPQSVPASTFFFAQRSIVLTRLSMSAIKSVL